MGFFPLIAKDRTQGLVVLGKCSTMELYSQSQIGVFTLVSLQIV